MGYMHIDNLYKNKDILLFNQCYALEKVHGTSAHIKWDKALDKLTLFSGGASYILFEKLFDKEFLKSKFTEIGCASCVVYGEAYGGKEQGMRETYGDELRFIVFDIEMSDKWLDVPRAEEIAEFLLLEFIPYELISTNIEAINAERDKESIVAVRRGCGSGKKREGIVLRPLIELTKNNGGRIISKHKADEFQERKNQPKVDDPEKQRILTEANAICNEWVTEMRLTHILGKIPQPWDTTQIPKIIKAMVEDVEREAKDEIVSCKEVSKLIGRKTALMFKERLKQSI